MRIDAASKGIFRVLVRVAVAISLAVAIVVFLVDLQTPLGLAIYMLYVLPILISLLADDYRFTLALAALFTALIAVGWILSHDVGVPRWIVTSNRLLAMFVVWSTAVVGLEMTRAKQRIRDLGRLLTICAWTKQIKVENGEWISIDRYLSDYCGITLTHGISEEAVE